MIEELLPFIVIGIIAVSIVYGMVHSHFSTKKRLANMEEVANELGLSWSQTGSLDQISHSGFNLFNQGRARKVSNLIEGVTDEVTIGIFDCLLYTSPSPRDRG